MLLLRRTRTRQPGAVVSVNWRLPITRGLVVAAIPIGRRFFDTVTHQFTEQLSTSAPSGAALDGNRSPAVRGAGLPASNNFPNRTGADDITSAYSVFWEGSPEVDGGVNYIFASVENSSGHGFAVGFDDASVQYNSLIARHYPSGIGASGAQYLGANAQLYVHRCAVTWDAATMSFYAKGKLAESSAFTAASTANANRRSHIGSGSAFFGSSNAGVSLVAVFNRVLRASEYAELHENPWQIFAPDERRIMLPSAGVAAPTLVSSTVVNIGSTYATPRVTFSR